MCIHFRFLNNFVPELCRFLFQSPFLFSSFFFSWFLYGEDVRIVSDSEFIFIGIIVYYGNGALKHVIFQGPHLMGDMRWKCDAMSMKPLIASTVVWL